MTSKKIFYREGYKYQLAKDAVFVLTGLPEDLPEDLYCGAFISLNCGNHLTVRKGYAYDGASGPTYDSSNTMRGSLLHDVGYQLIRNGFIAEIPWREYFDGLLRKLLLEDGVFGFRAWYYYRAVRAFGCCAVQNPKEVLCAP